MASDKNDAGESDAIAVLLRNDSTIDELMRAFEDAAQLPDSLDGQEYWFATDLMQLFDYSRWTKFRPVVEKARAACVAAGQDPEAHFANANGTAPWDPDGEVMYRAGTNPSGGRPGEDVILSRYAAYLTAENADSSKPPVAFAQTYFATQTRRAELADDAAARKLSNDEKRVLLRTKLREHNKALAEAAHTAGVSGPAQFRNFMGAGLKGLYGGMSKAQLLKHKGLPDDGDHLNHAGHEELAANYFKATQAEAKLRREGVSGPRAANAAHKEVGEAVRRIITDLGNTPPEDLPAEDHIRQAQKRVKAANAPALPKTGNAARKAAPLKKK